jgi:hypothetical protein
VSAIPRAFLVATVGALVLSACRYTGPSDLFLSHRFTWFSYVAGEDIAERCTAGAPDVVRLVYKAVYGEQVRAYDVVATADGAQLDAQVLVPAYANDITVSPPYGPLGIFGPRRSARSLNSAERNALLQGMAESGAFVAAKPGVELHSLGYYWAIASCRDGKFTFAAFTHPSSDVTRLAFVPPLMAVDPIKIPLRIPPPGPPPLDTGPPRTGEISDPDKQFYFVLVTGKDGRLWIR